MTDANYQEFGPAGDMCKRCGSLVLSKETHDAWHAKVDAPRRRMEDWADKMLGEPES